MPTAVGGEREVLFEPSHLRGVQFARRIIGLALGEETIVDAYIVLIATVEGIDIIAIGRSADVYVRLPDVSAGGSMAMLHDMASLIFYLMVAGKVGVTAEEFVSSLE